MATGMPRNTGEESNERCSSNVHPIIQHCVLVQTEEAVRNASLTFCSSILFPKTIAIK